jgi:SAM-dependent methyltransferase
MENILLIPFNLHRRLPLIRRPFYQRDRAIAERDELAERLRCAEQELEREREQLFRIQQTATKHRSLAESNATTTGYIDAVDNFQVRGWCIQDRTHEPDRVIIYVDGEEVARVPCNLPRPDVQNAELGASHGGFCYLHPHVVDPQKVTVQSLSSGKILPRVPHATSFPGRLAPFDCGLGVEPIYAVRPYAPVLDDRRGDSKRLFVRATALAPLNAALDVVPAMDERGYQVDTVECCEAPIDGLAPDAPNYRNLNFTVTIAAPVRKSYFAFNLVDTNQESPASGKNPITPVASMCVPIEYDWFSPFPGSEDVTRIWGAEYDEFTPPDAPNVIRTWEAVRGNFITSGVSVAYQMHALANEFLGEGQSLTILDWGIGIGRVAVPLKRLFRPSARILGVDVDGLNVKWCRENYPDIETVDADFFPPLDIESSSIDMVYGLSVMTHLTEGAQYAWLKELRRILKPEGLCVLTTLGEYGFAKARRLPWPVVEQLSIVGISDLMLGQGSPLDFERYYRTTFQTRKQIQEQWPAFLNLVAFYPAGHKALQDIVVMRR